MSEKRNNETYEALKKQFADAASSKADMAAQFDEKLAEANAEIGRLERKVNEGVRGLGFEEYQKANVDLDAAFNRLEWLEKQQKEFQKTPFVGKAEYREFRKSLRDERKAAAAAAEAEIYKLLRPLAAVAEKYTTIINELHSLEYVYVGCFGKAYGETTMGLAFEPYFPYLLNELNRVLSSAFNQFAKENGEEQAAIYDAAELTNERRELMKYGQTIGFAGLPELRSVERNF